MRPLLPPVTLMTIHKQSNGRQAASNWSRIEIEYRWCNHRIGNSQLSCRGDYGPHRCATPWTSTSATKTRSSSSPCSASSASAVKPILSLPILDSTSWRKLLAQTSTAWKFCHGTSCTLARFFYRRRKSAKGFSGLMFITTLSAQIRYIAPRSFQIVM